MPRKLGQHFLKNHSAIRAIVAALDPQPNETVIEIGPGHGELTRPLAERCAEKKCRLIAIERDVRLAEELRESARNWVNSNWEIVAGDALKELPRVVTQLPITNYLITGNLPYYLSGKLLRIISELDPKPRACVLTLQREVAERLAAAPPQMNLLAAAVQVWAEPRILMLLTPADFSPPPNVESAIVELKATGNSVKSAGADHGARKRQGTPNYYRFIRILFKQPRKTVLNNIAAGYKIPKESAVKTLKEHGLAGAERPQNLDLDTILSLSHAFGSPR